MSLLTDLKALLRIAYLRNVLLVALAGALLLPLLLHFVVYPQFSSYLVSVTEDDARRVAGHLALELGAVEMSLGAPLVEPGFAAAAVSALDTLGLKKLKLFGPDGRVIYSTDPGDIGSVNHSEYFHRRVAQGQQFTQLVEKRQRTAEGLITRTDVVETYIPIQGEDGGFAGAFEIYLDISERWEALEAIVARATYGATAVVSIILVATILALTRAARVFEEREKAYLRIQLAAQVMDNAQEGVVVTDVAGRIESVNRAYTEITGYEAAEVLGLNPRLLRSGRHDAPFYDALWRALKEQGSWQGEIWNRRKNGEIYPQWLTITAIKNSGGVVTHYVGVFSDISHFKHNESRLQHLAYRDALTGLPNRLLVNDRLEQYLASARRKNGKLALLFLDLDGFKSVNDSYGHNVGDALLQGVVARFLGCIREEDTLARLGGDEFLVVLNRIEADSEAEVIAARLIAALDEKSLIIEHHPCAVGVSVGISLYPQHGEDADTLIRRADIAMYGAKAAGKGRLLVYSPDLPRRGGNGTDLGLKGTKPRV
jgi:diguanylate cyclase (GGDEF)-like protein/PAS domain S-box-containing protein